MWHKIQYFFFLQNPTISHNVDYKVSMIWFVFIGFICNLIFAKYYSNINSLKSTLPLPCLPMQLQLAAYSSYIFFYIKNKKELWKVRGLSGCLSHPISIWLWVEELSNSHLSTVAEVFPSHAGDASPLDVPDDLRVGP